LQETPTSNWLRRSPRGSALPLGEAVVGRFSDGETAISIYEPVRGSDVFIIQSTSTPVNENLVELLILIDALRRASAGQDHRGHALLRLCAAGP
jgi:phosphoribosylpyrophosphate synthetase